MGKLILAILLLLLFPVSSFSGKLLTSSDMTYAGAFRVPNGQLGGDSLVSRSLGRGGDGIVYNPTNNSLLMFGNPDEKLAVEVSIPTPIISDNITELNTSAVIHTPKRIQAYWSNMNIDGSDVANGAVTGTMLLYNNRLIVNQYTYYASEISGPLTHFAVSSNLDGELNYTEKKRVGTYYGGAVTNGYQTSNSGFTGGFMFLVPEEWQSALGFPAITGGGALAITSRASYGPSIWGFDPDDITSLVEPITIIDAEEFVGYPSSHPTLGDYGSTVGTLYYNMSTKLYGGVFPNSTDTVLIFGTTGKGFTGLGDSCYGFGVTDPELHNVLREDGENQCYDPIDLEKGTHGYPYTVQVYAYDANDFLDVKNNVKDYWEIIPYDRWEIVLPYSVDNYFTGQRTIGGSAYDPETKRLFIPQIMGDSLSAIGERTPIIHVYQLNTTENSGVHLSGTGQIPLLGSGTMTLQ